MYHGYVPKNNITPEKAKKKLQDFFTILGQPVSSKSVEFVKHQGMVVANFEEGQEDLAAFVAQHKNELGIAQIVERVFDAATQEALALLRDQKAQQEAAESEAEAVPPQMAMNL